MQGRIMPVRIWTLFFVTTITPKLLLDHSSMEVFLFIWGNSLIPPSHTLEKNRLLVPFYPLRELHPFFIGIYIWKLDRLPVAQAVGNSKGLDEIWSETFMNFAKEHLTIELTLRASFIEHIPFRLGTNGKGKPLFWVHPLRAHFLKRF